MTAMQSVGDDNVDIPPALCLVPEEIFSRTPVPPLVAIKSGGAIKSMSCIIITNETDIALS